MPTQTTHQVPIQRRALRLKLNPVRVVLVALICSTLPILGGCTSHPDDADALSEPVAQAREQTRAELEAQLNELLAMPTVQKVEGSAFYDACTEGDDNWKRTDPYLYKCAMSLTGFAILTTDPAKELTELVGSLRTLGWESHSTLERDKLEDPSEGGTSCLLGVYSKDGIVAYLDISTPQRRAGECWHEGSFDTLTGFGFWKQKTSNIPTWEQIGSPEVALAITVADVYYEKPRE